MSGFLFESNLKEEKVSRTFHLHKKQVEELKNVSKHLGVPQSELVRRSVQHFLNEFKEYHTKNDSK